MNQEFGIAFVFVRRPQRVTRRRLPARANGKLAGSQPASFQELLFGLRFRSLFLETSNELLLQIVNEGIELPRLDERVG